MSHRREEAAGRNLHRLDGLFREPADQLVLFLAVVTTMVGIRYAVFAADGAPPTIDAGNWLAFGDSLLGDDTRSATIAYPPVVPLLTTALVALFGLTAGVSLMAAIAAAAPAIGVYATLAAIGVGRPKLFVALVLLGVGSVGEAASWGGFPQLIAMGLLPYATYATQRFLERPDIRRALVAGVAAMAVLAVSHFVAAVLVAAGVVLVVQRAVETRSADWARRVAVLAPLVVVPSLWLAPIYLDLVEAVLLDPNPFAELDNLTAGTFLDRLEGIYADAPVLWRVLIPLTVITPFLRWTVGRSTLVPMQRALFLGLAVMLVISREGRYLYLLPTLAMLSVAIWLREAARRIELDGRGHRHRRWIAVVAAAALVAQAWAGLRILDDQRAFYTALSPLLVDGIEAADRAAGDDGAGLIAVPSVRNAPLGWWVEALTDDRVLYGSALRWLNFADELERASVANEIFAPSFPSPESLAVLRARGVDVVVVPRTWEWFDDDALATWIAAEGLDTVVWNGDVVVVAVGEAPGGG